MEKNESIDHVLENMDKSIVYKAKKSPLRIILLFAVGIISFVAHSVLVWETSSIFPPLFMLLGFTAIVTAIFILFFQKGNYISAVSHQKLKTLEFYFHVNERDKLVRLIETRNLKELKDLKPSMSDGLRLEVVTSRDGKICLSQVIAYISNEYTNVTSVQTHTADEALVFSELLKTKKSN